MISQCSVMLRSGLQEGQSMTDSVFCFYSISDTIHLFFCLPIIHLFSSLLQFFKDKLHTMLRYAKFLVNSSLRISSWVQKYNFMPVKLGFYDILPVTKRLKIKNKIISCKFFAMCGLSTGSVPCFLCVTNVNKLTN